MIDLFETAYVLDNIGAERRRQVEKWGEQHHRDIDPADDREFFADCAKDMKQQNGYAAASWTDILLEEVYEALAEGDAAKLRAELVQVAAVAVAWIEDIDSREGEEN